MTSAKVLARPLLLVAAFALAFGETQLAAAQALDATPDAPASADAAGDTPISGPHGPRPITIGHSRILPYLELDQQVFAELTSPNQVLTYTTLAAGLDASITGRQTEAAVSVRYEHRIGESGGAFDSDTISGLVRVHHDLVPRTLAIEAGAMGTRTSIGATGGASGDGLLPGSRASQTWAVYGGPALSTHMGDVAVNASYLAGYTKVGAPGAVVSTAGIVPVDSFDHSLAQSAQLGLSTRPGAILPVGLGANVGYDREDISNLDQRVEDFHAMGEVFVPVSFTVELVGGLGYEHVKVSSRDVLRDATGAPVIGSDGRYVTNHALARQVAFDTSGLIWEAGLVWKPSRRTSLSAYVGRRYGDLTYWGNATYAPDSRSAFGVAVYQGLSGLGGTVTNALRALPTDFTVIRDPITGQITSCAIGTATPNATPNATGPASTGSGCLSDTLVSVNSSVFRSTGVVATYGHKVGRMQASLGAGYNYRRFIGAPGTILALGNGTVDRNLFASAALSGPIGVNGAFTTVAYANWYWSAQGTLGDTRGYGVTGSYSRTLADHLLGTIAVGVEGVQHQAVPDSMVASLLLGLRYTF